MSAVDYADRGETHIDRAAEADFYQRLLTGQVTHTERIYWSEVLDDDRVALDASEPDWSRCAFTPDSLTNVVRLAVQP